MRISILGLGYVGTVSAGCLSRDGHDVIGVDPAEDIVNLLNKGQSPIIENQIDQLIKAGVTSGRLSATTETWSAVMNTDLTMICVGTPSSPNGALDYQYIQSACKQIATALKDKPNYHTVVMRSTVLPGTLLNLAKPTLEASSGKTAGIDFGLCNNPEFLREGTAVKDYDNPPKTLIGEMEPRSGELLAQLYGHLDAPLIRTSVEVSEMVKYSDNVWHALKISFANEIGAICKANNLDSHTVMDIFCQDTKLNLSRHYLKPGFAFGGSCLPKDIRALSHCAQSLDVETPVINAILPSNRTQIDNALKTIIGYGKRAIGFLGCSFKAGTDDLRESPLVELIEQLIGKGFNVKIYDKNVQTAHPMGASRNYLLTHHPHLEGLFVKELDTLLSHAQLLVIGNASPEFIQALNQAHSEQIILDLVRIQQSPCKLEHYHGISW